MNQENLLLDVLRDLWNGPLATIVREGFVAGEHEFQSHFASLLRTALPRHRICLERRVSVDGATVIPDLLIAEKMEIRAVGELKFVPWGYVPWEDDFRKLKVLAEMQHEVQLKWDLFSGTAVECKSTTSDSTRFIYGVYGNVDSEAVYESCYLDAGLGALRGRLLLLYGRVSDGRMDTGATSL